MTLKNQVTSLDLSKRLKELGVKQESYWHHVVWPDVIPLHDLAFNPWQDFETKQVEWINTKGNRVTESVIPLCSAFTVAELGEILSSHFNEWAQGWNDSGCFWHFQFGGRGCGNMMEGFGQKFSALDEDTEADARAKMLIHLLENKLLTL